MEPVPTQELQCTADTLLVFIDDTGHEAFKGTQDYYGLGGCTVLGAHYGHLKAKWMDVRRRINGDGNTPLHAADMARENSNFEVLSEFFLEKSFARIAAFSTKNAKRPDGMHPAVPVMGAIEEYINDIASLAPCKRVALIVESSQRADPILKEHFGELSADALKISRPIDYVLMPKSSGEPGLEIADFIINAAGSQTRRHLKGQSGFAPDFDDVFRRLPLIGCRYNLVTDVIVDPTDGRVAVSGIRLGPSSNLTPSNDKSG